MTDQLSWPALASPYGEALRAAVEFILERYQVLGIIASGSIIRGNPGPSSDLDIYVVHAQPQRQRVQKWFNGVPAELFINPPETIRSYFKNERKAGHPSSAHMLATGFVILDRDPVVEQLHKEAVEWLTKRPDLSPSRLLWLRYAASDLLDNAKDLQTTEPANAAMILHQAVQAIVEYLFLAANQNLPRAKEMVSTAERLNPSVGALVRAYYMTSDATQRFVLAEEMAQQVMGVTFFFEWESEMEVV